MRAVRVAVAALAGVAVSFANAAAAPETSRPPRDGECLVCHSQNGDEKAPQVDVAAYYATVHADEGCIGCHPDVEDPDIAHEKEFEDLEPVVCGSCHQDQQGDYAQSVHGAKLVAEGPDTDAATCARCHGDHAIRRVTDPRSRVHPLQQPETCNECHEQTNSGGHLPSLPDDLRGQSPEQLAAAMENGTVQLAGCASCHRPHDTARVDDPASGVAYANGAATCGTCHGEERDAYLASAHGRPSDTTDDRPTCGTCHRVHSIPPPSDPKFRTSLVAECGTCHEALMETYQESYHGKATILGDGVVAKCSDCHGYHGILPADEPGSAVHPDNVLATCQTCHEDADGGFAEFWPHADPHDREGYPALYWVWLFMTTLLVSVFAFFGLHTLLWGIRESIDAIRAGRPHAHPTGGRQIKRFSTYHRVTHGFVIISFLGLALTGAPLKYPEAGWASVVFGMFGGVKAAGTWHRFFAVITFGYFVAHVGWIVQHLWRKRKTGLRNVLIGPNSVVPRLADLKDAGANIKWFVGLGPKPTFDRWTYWEKFDYWAVFWGVAIIGGSGLILWFPTLFSSAFPGWIVNIALVVHSDEALLAMGFIFGVHFFNSHLRRSKFPMDAVMFTGTVPEAEFREERGRQWERIEAEGRVDELTGKPPHPGFLAVMRVFGISAWLTGLVILGLIIHGFLRG